MRSAKPARKVTEPAPEASAPWLTITVDAGVLQDNIAVFRQLVAPTTQLMAVVKADAYGHGLLIAAEAFLAGGGDMLGVHSLAEARRLREAGQSVDILVLGPVSGAEALQAAALGVEVTLPGLDPIREICTSLAASQHHPSQQESNQLEAQNFAPRELRAHLKVDTGVNRQGIRPAEWPAVREILKDCPQLNLVGIASHFADIEDTTDHVFAEEQMSRFDDFVALVADSGYDNLKRHMTCSAATLLWPQARGDIARVGIGAYGIWPSREIFVSVRQQCQPEVVLQPALTWQVRISQVREVPAGETVGYGRTWKAVTDSRIAVLPVGYADGWPRGLGGRAHVLVGGRRAPLVGRICMNLCMVDVTNVPDVHAGDMVVLLGRQAEEVITAEELADHLGTIAYEVLTLPGPSWTRRIL